MLFAILWEKLIVGNQSRIDNDELWLWNASSSIIV